MRLFLPIESLLFFFQKFHKVEKKNQKLLDFNILHANTFYVHENLTLNIN